MHYGLLDHFVEFSRDFSWYRVYRDWFFEHDSTGIIRFGGHQLIELYVELYLHYETSVSMLVQDRPSAQLRYDLSEPSSLVLIGAALLRLEAEETTYRNACVNAHMNQLDAGLPPLPVLKATNSEPEFADSSLR
jgi:hypothetical protein